MDIELLKQLVRIPSYVDSTSDESALCEFIAGYLAKNCPHVTLIEQPIQGRRKNLIALQGENPRVVLFSHMDTVVPPSQRDTFDPKTDGGKLFGLGAVDTKAGVMLGLEALSKIRNRRIGLILTVDEEYDLRGASALAKEWKLKPELIINLEPTDLKVMQGCRGISQFRVEFKGITAHVARKRGSVSAVTEGVACITNLERSLRSKDTPRVQTSVNIGGFIGGTLNPDGSLLKVGNKVPDYAEALVDIRLGSDLSKEDISKAIEETASKKRLEIESMRFDFHLRGFYTCPEKFEDFSSAFRKALGRNPILGDINSAGFYEVQFIVEAWGSPAIVFGPGPSSMAHKAGEYVEIETIQKAWKVLNEYLSGL